MYDQGLATITLCECYGMSNAKDIRKAAQAALNFIMARKTNETAVGVMHRSRPAIFR